VKSTQPHPFPAGTVTWFDTPNNAPGLPPESAYNTASTGCEPLDAPNPDTYPDNFDTNPACGAEYNDTSFKSTDAESVNDPGDNVPNVLDDPANTTPVANDCAEADPALFDAVTRTRIVEPTSAETNV
jgi:hypothetical protein